MTPGASDDSNNYLIQLVEWARVDGGVSLPLLGSASLAEARQVGSTTVSNLTKLAREALAAGNRDSAEQIISEALRRDPYDATALSLKGALTKLKPGGGVAMAAGGPPAGNSCRQGNVGVRS